MIIRDIENMYVHCEHKYDKDFSDLNVGDLHSHLDILEIIYVIKGNHDYMIESNIYIQLKRGIYLYSDLMSCTERAERMERIMNV